LSTVEKTIFFRALFLLSISRFSLQFKKFKSVVYSFSQKAAEQKPVLISSIPPAKVANLLIAAANIVPFSTCLSKSLAGSVLFRSLGYKTLLHIGVTKENGCLLEAHAWLTLDCSVIVGYRSDLARYHELPLIFDNEKNSSL
jgi:hypothetical protein